MYSLFNLEVFADYCRNLGTAVVYLTPLQYRTVFNNREITEDKITLLSNYHHTYRKISAVRFVESIFEAVPQMTLQMYIIAVNPEDAGNNMQ